MTAQKCSLSNRPYARQVLLGFWFVSLFSCIAISERLAAQSLSDDLSRSVDELRSSIGEWQVTTRILAPDGSVRRTVEGTYEFSWVVPDRVVIGKNEVPELAQASGFLLYIHEREREIEMVSVSDDGRLWVMTGPLGGNVRSTPPFPLPRGGEAEFRFVRYNVREDGGGFESRQERSTDGGRTWQPANHQTFVRAAPGAVPTEHAVIYLLRHAEPQYPPPADAPRDPPLNSRGRARAEALARLLSSENITEIWSSDYRRTQETAAPLAEQLGLRVRSYDPRALGELARSLGSAEGRIVVLGHSNTTPALVGLLGGEPGEPIDENVEFDRLYVLTRGSDGSAQTLTLRYGDPTDPDWETAARP